MILMSCWRWGGMSTWGVMPACKYVLCLKDGNLEASTQAMWCVWTNPRPAWEGVTPVMFLVIGPVLPPTPHIRPCQCPSGCYTFIIKFLSLFFAQNGTRQNILGFKFLCQCQGAFSSPRCFTLLSFSLSHQTINCPKWTNSRQSGYWWWESDRSCQHSSQFRFSKDQKRPDNH